jgi:hypothetical protein
MKFRKKSEIIEAIKYTGTFQSANEAIIFSEGKAYTCCEKIVIPTIG